jgi:hypothetical protein
MFSFEKHPDPSVYWALIAEYWRDSPWAVGDPVPQQPYEQIWEELPIPVWPLFPEVMPIQKPVTAPIEIPFRDLPHRPDSPYRETGPDAPAVSRVEFTPRVGFTAAPTIGIAPDVAGAGGVSVPGTNQHAVPPKGNREAKYRSQRLIRMWLMIGAATEVDDALECAWKSLPEKYRKEIKGKHNQQTGETIYYWEKDYARSKGISDEARKQHNDRYKQRDYQKVHPRPQDMMNDILAHPEELNEAKFQKCFAINAAVDAAIGIAAIKTRQNFAEFRRKQGLPDQWLHIGTGPVL